MEGSTVSVTPAASNGSTPLNIGRGLRCLAVLNEWERVHMPFLKSTSGRDLYFLLVKHFLLSPDPSASIPLKSFTVDLTDKAMRRRMQEFEQLDWLVIEVHDDDARRKTIRPTQRLRDLFDAHSLMMRRCFRHYFHYVPKYDAPPLNSYHELMPQPHRHEGR